MLAMGGEAMAFKAIAVKRHGVIHDPIHCYRVAADAVLLHDAAGFFLARMASGIWPKVKAVTW